MDKPITCMNLSAGLLCAKYGISLRPLNAHAVVLRHKSVEDYRPKKLKVQSLKIAINISFVNFASQMLFSKLSWYWFKGRRIIGNEIRYSNHNYSDDYIIESDV